MPFIAFAFVPELMLNMLLRAIAARAQRKPSAPKRIHKVIARRHIPQWRYR